MICQIDPCTRLAQETIPLMWLNDKAPTPIHVCLYHYVIIAALLCAPIKKQEIATS